MSSTIYTNAAIGNVGNLLLLTCTLVITACMLYQLPSPDYFDSHWLSAGFCVTASHTIWRNSHLLSFYADTALAAVLYYMYQNAPRKTKQNELQLELLRGSISGVFFHGLGHMYVGFQPMGMDLRWNPSEDLVRSVASTIVTVGTFFSIFNSTMPFASVKQLILTSVIATAGFTVMDLEPKLNFVYAQAAVYVFTALHMLLRLNEVHKGSKIYAMYPYFQLIVLFVGILEATQCTAFLASLGGHMVFDSSIAIGAISMQLLSSSRTSADDKPKTTKTM